MELGEAKGVMICTSTAQVREENYLWAGGSLL